MIVNKCKTGSFKSSRCYNADDCMKTVGVLRTKSLVEDFYRDECQTVYGGKAVRFRNDIYLVLNQKRLDRMTQAQLSEWLNHDQTGQSFSELRQNLTDEQLHRFIKSRYIQSPSELRAWQQYLETQFNNTVSEAQVAAQAAAQSQQATTDAPAPAASE